MALQIPTVTIDDLCAFHGKHFPHASAPEHYLHGVGTEAIEECSEELDDGLGYYPDGVKRTLTDEQIAMFRHSEIQAILRQRKRQQEGGEMSDQGYPVADSPPQPVSPLSTALDPVTPASAAALGPTNTIPPETSDKVESGRVEKPAVQRWATSSARTKAKNRKHRDRYQAKKKAARLQQEQAKKNGRQGDEDDESDEWDPWHQANGPDVQKDDALDLDY